MWNKRICFCRQVFTNKIRALIAPTLLLIGIVFGCSNAYAADTNITLEVSPLDELSLTPEVLNTTSHDVVVETNSENGYTLTIETNSNSSDASLMDELTGASIPTIVLPNGLSTVNSASFGYGYGYSIDGANFKPAPVVNGGGDILDTTSKANTGSANSYKITYGVKIPDGMPAGSYSREFLITASVNTIEACLDEYICYNSNGSDLRATMADQYAGSNAEVTLKAPQYRRSGYGFVGWNTQADGKGTYYGPNQTITTGDLSESGMNLYAIWLKSSGTIQNWMDCEKLAMGARIALTDSRDGSTYTVAKLADGECWMTENLRLDLSDENLRITIDNTNNPAVAFLRAANEHPASTSNFCIEDSSACADKIQYNNLHLDASNDDAVYAYGNYYNWYTATAGNGTRSSTSDSGAAAGDICPKGWRLPTGLGATGDLTVLDVALGGNGKNAKSAESSNLWRSIPVNIVYGGEYNGSSVDVMGSSGHYHASTANNVNRSNNLWIIPSSVSTNSNGSLKTRGQTIRCVADKTFLVEFDANNQNATVLGDMPDQRISRGISTKLNSNTFYIEETETKRYSFLGWNTKANGTGTFYRDGALVNNLAGVGEVITLYAQWQEFDLVTVTVDFVDDGTTSVMFREDNYGTSYTVTESGQSVKLVIGTKYILSMTLRDTYSFKSWAATSGVTSYLDINPTDYTPGNENATISVATNLREGVLYMQDVDYPSCTASPMTVYDNRDGQQYTIMRLKDGECWMLDNLRIGALRDTSVITPTNTNISEDTSFTLPAPTTVLNSYTSPQLNADSVDTEMTVNGSGSGKIGVYYNFCAISAGTLCTNSAKVDITEDLCPAGWRLPSGNSTTGDFANLYTAYNKSVDSTLGALSLPTAGYYNASTAGITQVNQYAYVWTSTGYNNNKSYMLSSSAYKYNTGGGGVRNNGLSARCILK